MRTFSLALSAVALIFTAMHSVADDFDSAGVKIHYAVQGEGDPVILIHGLYSNGRMNWDLPGTTALSPNIFKSSPSIAAATVNPINRRLKMLTEPTWSKMSFGSWII